MLDDLVTFQKIKKGDIQAFEFLFRKYYKPLCLYASGITQDMNVAEEIVQDLFYTIWKEKENLQIRISGKSYLYKSVKNKSLQHIEHIHIREKYWNTISESNSDLYMFTPANNLEYKELEDYVSRILERMPERRRKIFRMNRFEGKKYVEIARELSLSVKTIEAEMSKALQALRKDIGNYQ